LAVLVSAAFAAISARLPKGWADLGRQIVILVSVDLAYTFVRGIADGHHAEAIHHGQQVIDFERATSTFFEPSLQAFFLPAQAVIASATGIAARLCRMEGRIGAVAPGAFADLVVVDGNPLADLSLLTGQGRHMPLIMKGGDIVKHAAW